MAPSCRRPGGTDNETLDRARSTLAFISRRSERRNWRRLLAGAEGLLRQAYLRLLDTLAENLKRRTHQDPREPEQTALIEPDFTNDRAGRYQESVVNVVRGNSTKLASQSVCY